MVETAAALVDVVIPEVPVRQWVLSLLYRVRVFCAYDADACALVRRVLVRAVSGFYERAARRAGLPRPRAGGSGVRAALRFGVAGEPAQPRETRHVLWLDGVFAWEPGRSPVFVEHGELTDGDVAKLVRVVRDRVRRCLRRRA